MKLRGENRSTRGKTCPSATLSATNPTWIEPGSNPGLCGERTATNYLSHGTASTQRQRVALTIVNVNNTQYAILIENARNE